MASFNRVIMLGNLTRDPQLTYLPSQTPVVEFGLATNRRFKTGDGQQKDEVCFIDCRAYGRLAETISKYCRKGRPLMIEGRLSFDQWEAQDGTKRSKHRITVENFQFVDFQQDQSSVSSPASAGVDNNQAAPPDDDIPF